MVAQLLRDHGPDVVARRSLSSRQLKALRAAQACRTAVLGGHVDECTDCGHQRPSYNSCRDRHCPTCQGSRQLKWVADRTEKILPVGHFHVVFTLPAELRTLALCNQPLVLGALFDGARKSLTALAKQRLGGQLGVTAVLHTWDQKLHYHPHVHCVVTAGAWEAGAARWRPSRSRYLFPVFLLSACWRSLLLQHLARMYDDGALSLTGRCAALADPRKWRRLLRRLWRKRWVVYAKRPFAGPEQVFRYLGRYTHRVAISDSRILTAETGRVLIKTRGGPEPMTGQQFVSRFLLHVLPHGFNKIRHFGLYAPSAANRALLQARQHLQRVTPVAQAPAATGRSTIQGDDPERGERRTEPPPCPACGGPQRRRPVVRATGPPHRARAP